LADPKLNKGKGNEGRDEGRGEEREMERRKGREERGRGRRAHPPVVTMGKAYPAPFSRKNVNFSQESQYFHIPVFNAPFPISLPGVPLGIL